MTEESPEPVDAIEPDRDAVSLPPALGNIVEALLLASEAPLSLDQIQRLVGEDFGIDRKGLREVLGDLSARLEGTAGELREVAGGWRLQVRPEYGPWVARLWQEKPPRFSRALLETLALVVYRQPITRGEIEEVRGVAVSGNILRTLLERGWIRELGHKEVPGRPMLYGTTSQLLDDLNLDSLSQLPELPAIKDLAQFEAALARLGLQMPAPESGKTEAAEPSEEESRAGADGTDSQDAQDPGTTLH